MQALDLFGSEMEPVEISKPVQPTAPKPKATAMLDRRKIWGEGGYLASIEDDETSIHTTSSFTENATIERLEKALFMVPVIRNGVWQYDGQFYQYKLTKSVVGARAFGAKGSFLREATMYLIQSSARNVLEEIYTDTGSWLPKWANWLFNYRLRKAGENEDPYELLKAFTAVLTQHDFLDASRKGDSLRTVTKRLHMQQKRAEARAALAASCDADFDEDQDDDDQELRTA